MLSKPVTLKTTTTQSAVSAAISTLPSEITTNSAASCSSSATGVIASNTTVSILSTPSSSASVSEQNIEKNTVTTPISIKAVKNECDSTSLKTKENNLSRATQSSSNFRATAENIFEKYSSPNANSNCSLTKNKLSQSAHNIFNKDDRKEDNKDIAKNLKDFHRKTNYLSVANKQTKTLSRIGNHNNNKANYNNNSNVTISNINKYNNNTTGHHNLINYRRKQFDNLHRSPTAFKIPSAVSTENIFATSSKSFGNKTAFSRRVSLKSSIKTIQKYESNFLSSWYVNKYIANILIFSAFTSSVVHIHTTIILK